MRRMHGVGVVRADVSQRRRADCKGGRCEGVVRHEGVGHMGSCCRLGDINVQQGATDQVPSHAMSAATAAVAKPPAHSRLQSRTTFRWLTMALPIPLESCGQHQQLDPTAPAPVRAMTPLSTRITPSALFANKTWTLLSDSRGLMRVAIQAWCHCRSTRRGLLAGAGVALEEEGLGQRHPRDLGGRRLVRWWMRACSSLCP